MHRVARCDSVPKLPNCGKKRILLPFGRNQKEVPRRHEAELKVSRVLPYCYQGCELLDAVGARD